ncbi:MAG: sigma-54-dependent Fis family transcriptional regulator [Paracoccaceae bacterium]|nr:sigma-54-dependent Fis family transcriptional regulator [Paracoccaceae bacterium]
MTDAPILLIEDTASLRMVYEALLHRAGHRVESAGTAQAGLAAFRKFSPSVVLLDLMLPDRDGLDLMADMLRADPGCRIIVVTANGSINKAVEAMRIGAQEFLVKPFDEQRLLAVVDNALRNPAPRPLAASPGAPTLGDFVGQSPAMMSVYDKIRSVARSMATVFITGESGTGKELCAQAIHDHSARAQAPFIALNCAAIPSDLMESEVFGHLRGSFTGAVSDKIGAAAAADGGTLFLDEVCEMDLALQTKFLRFLQTSTVQPVGATRPRKVNVRIVCATNRDPLEEVSRGRFREDLYYRLHVVPIRMPPLRDRGSDIITIAEAMLMRLAAEEGRSFDGLDPQVQALFQHHRWPGNVRQLINVLRNVVVLNEGGLVSMQMLPSDLLAQAGAIADGPPDTGRQDAPPPLSIESLVGLTLAEIEQRVIEATIAEVNGSLPAAARILGVSPSTLYRKRAGWVRDAAE